MSDAEARMRAHDAYDLIEEQFNQELDRSLGPAGPDSLLRYVAEMALPAGAVVVDAGCGEGEHAVADAVVATLAPVRDRYQELSRDPGHVRSVLQAGAARASQQGREKVRQAKAAMGLLPA